MANSPLLQIPQVAPSQTNKETTINDGFSILERSLNDIKEISLVDADVTLNLTDYTRAFLFKLDAGTATGRTLSVPASKRIFSVRNDGDHDIVISVDGESGLDATIHSASMCVLFNDGVNVYLISDSAASGQVSAFLSLPDTPNSFTGHAGEAMVVNEAEDALDFGTITVAFKDLTDGPSSYTGQGGKTVRVNSGATGIEFGTTYSALKLLTDTPDSYADNAGKMLVVKTEEDGIEFVDIPDGVIVATRIYALLNAGFEDGDLTNWTVPSTSGSVWAVGNTFGFLNPSEGTKLAYFDTGQGNEATAISYDIDLTDQAYADELDEGPSLQVVISMGSVTSDSGYIEVEFFTDSGASISTATSPSYTGTTTMLDRTFKADVPETARTATIYLYAIHDEASEDANNITFAFDNLRVSLKVNVDQINYFTQLQDTPSTFTDEAGKALVVNPNEDGLTFAAMPSVRDTFVQLTDTPANYNSAAKKYVRVNSAADALEFVQPTFLELSDTPTAFTGKSKRILRVNSAESAIEFVAIALGDLSGVDFVTDAPTDGQVLTYDSSGTGSWKPVTPNVTQVISISSKTGDYTLVLDDAYNKYFRLDKSTPIGLTVPANSTAAIPVGSIISGIQAGTGQVSFGKAAGVTINTPESLKLRTQYSSFTLTKVGTDEWDLAGDLEALA